MEPFIVTDNNIHISNSYEYSKNSFGAVFSMLRRKYPKNMVLLNRSDKSMAREWATHNLFYDLNLFRFRTADVDLNYPQRWWEKLGYFIIGTFALWVIK